MARALELRCPSVWLDGQEVLRDVAWDVERGEHWALQGANGSGKTTLLRVLTGYLWPARGTLRVLGRTFGEVDLREPRRSIGFVSAALAARLPPGLDALSIVASGFEAWLGLGWRPFRDEERRAAREALELLGVGALSERSFGTLSEGEQQRVLIARGLVHRPALLLLDESCAGLDPAARERFLADLGAVAARSDPPTMVLASHHVEEIPSFVTHAMVLRAGAVLAQGRAEDVVTSPVLTRALDRPCEVTRYGPRFGLRVVLE